MGVEGYLTVNEAAAKLGVSGGRVRQLVADGKLASIKVGNLRLIQKTDVEAFELPAKGRPKVENPSKNTLAQREYRKNLESEKK